MVCVCLRDLTFLSTPSARRATAGLRREAGRQGYFYPRPPRGGRQDDEISSGFFSGISIHALREEGDQCKSGPAGRPERFLSTPSARRATYNVLNYCDQAVISIHALREEGDSWSRWFRSRDLRFLSTPSARRATTRQAGLMQKATYFYPRPPRGGRRSFSRGRIGIQEFLSTPSARRATGDAGRIQCAPVISIHALREEGDL